MTLAFPPGALWWLDNVCVCAMRAMWVLTGLRTAIENEMLGLKTLMCA